MVSGSRREGVIRDHHILRVPDELLAEAHLAPIRPTAWQRHWHMLSVLAVAGNDAEGERPVGNQK